MVFIVSWFGLKEIESVPESLLLLSLTKYSRSYNLCSSAPKIGLLESGFQGKESRRSRSKGPS